jgi:hypothetical protein
MVTYVLTSNTNNSGAVYLECKSSDNNLVSWLVNSVAIEYNADLSQDGLFIIGPTHGGIGTSVTFKRVQCISPGGSDDLTLLTNLYNLIYSPVSGGGGGGGDASASNQVIQSNLLQQIKNNQDTQIIDETTLNSTATSINTQLSNIHSDTTSINGLLGSIELNQDNQTTLLSSLDSVQSTQTTILNNLQTSLSNIDNNSSDTHTDLTLLDTSVNNVNTTLATINTNLLLTKDIIDDIKTNTTTCNGLISELTAVTRRSNLITQSTFNANATSTVLVPANPNRTFLSIFNNSGNVAFFGIGVPAVNNVGVRIPSNTGYEFPIAPHNAVELKLSAGTGIITVYES